jgi:hypothetical protein
MEDLRRHLEGYQITLPRLARRPDNRGHALSYPPSPPPHDSHDPKECRAACAALVRRDRTTEPDLR